MGDLCPFYKAALAPPMPQQPRTNEPDDQDHAGALLATRQNNYLSTSRFRPQCKNAAILSMLTAFLFDEDVPQTASNMDIEAAFLSAVKGADCNRSLRSRVLRGGLVIAQLAYKPAKVFSSGPKTSKRGVAPNSTGVEMHGDKGLFATLIGDLCDAFADQPNTLDLEALWGLLGRRSVCCICLTDLPPDFVTSIDRRLRQHPAYLGSLEIDLGNPLQRQLFADYLYKDAFIQDGCVFMPIGVEGYIQGSFNGVEEFSDRPIIGIGDEFEFKAQAPPIDIPDEFSARGLVSFMRLRKRTGLNVHQKIASGLSTNLRPGNLATDFSWDLKQLPDAGEEVVANAAKIVYLVTENEKNSGKDGFFRGTLGISKEDIEFLQSQLIDRLREVEYEDIRLDQYGICFNAVLPVVGMNGNYAQIKTGWIVRPGERASLVTAFPARHSVIDDVPLSNVILPNDSRPPERWHKLYELACITGLQAAMECVPTPMKIIGYPVIMEGAAGGAHIVVEDGRRGFAKWLKD